MKSELAQGNMNMRKKSGHYNISETTCAPHYLCWLNESCLRGATSKRTAFDDLSLGQFVVGFQNNTMDTTNPQVAKAMLTELIETVKLSKNLSWPIARGAFAVAIHHIEEETVNWSDSRFQAENRLTFSQSEVFNPSRCRQKHSYYILPQPKGYCVDGIMRAHALTHKIMLTPRVPQAFVTCVCTALSNSKGITLTWNPNV